MSERPPRWFGPLLWGVGAVVLAAGALMRINEAATLPPSRFVAEPFATPWQRPPLFDSVTAPFESAATPAVLVGLVAVVLCVPLARAALPPAGRLAAMAAAAVCPSMVMSGSFWIPSALVVPLAAATAWLLIEVLTRHDGGSPTTLALLAFGLLISDWPAWSPVLAWLGWLTVFRPAWMDPERARRALVALLAAAAAGAACYGAVLFQGADPVGNLGGGSFPLGLQGAEALTGSVASPLLGAGHGHSLGVRAAAACLVVVLVAVGWRRATRSGAGPWASVLVVGSAGSLVPALAVHPLMPFAADKNLWYASPMVLCLAIAAFWPSTGFRPGGANKPAVSQTRLRPVTAGLVLALLLLPACTDEDEDGWAVQQGDCDDTNATVYPDAPELWNDGIDNDCDEVIDASDDYVFATEQEPNDTTIGSCFAPEGHDIGRLAGPGLLTRITGRVDEVVDESYDEGDLDCFAFRVPDEVEHPRLQIQLSWPDEESDLDVVLQGLWEGEQSGFGASQVPGPGPEFLVSSSGFDPGAPLWLWIGGYDGPPTDYQVDLVLR
jgi:hypothetical protein